MKILECVPNISEGRDTAKVARIARAAGSVPGARLLDLHSDPDHNRSVLTLAGDPVAVLESAYRMTRAAVEEIDLRAHTGEHPRVGAVDVVPLVPLQDVSEAEAVDLARMLGSRLAEELDLPVLLYGAAHPQGRTLPEIRKGGLTALGRALTGPRKPDFGPARLHPTAGALALGVRKPLIAFNVDLATTDLDLAKAIAREVREAGGGLPGIRAIGVARASLGRVQVSMNITDYRRCGLAAAYAAVEERALVRGVDVAAVEIVGLAPREALLAAAGELLHVEGYGSGRVLEDRLADEGLLLDRAGWIAALASDRPTPGGGAAAALVGSLAAALACMVSKFGPRDESLETRTGLEAVLGEAEFLYRELERLSRRDEEAYRAWVSAKDLPAATDEERNQRRERMAAAMRDCVAVPLAAAEGSIRALELARRCLEAGKPALASDAGIAAHLARAGAESALLLVRANLAGVKDVGAGHPHPGVGAGHPHPGSALRTQAGDHARELSRKLGAAWEQAAPLLP